MLLLRFPNYTSMHNFGQMISAAQNILAPDTAAKVGGDKLEEYVKKLKDSILYVEEPEKHILHIKTPSDVLFVLENMHWILENTPQAVQFPGSSPEESKRTMELMKKQLEEAIHLIRVNSNTPVTTGKRIFFPSLQKIYTKNKGAYVRFEAPLDLKRIYGTEDVPFKPEVGELWVIEEYVPADPNGKEEAEDTLKIKEKDGSKGLELPASEIYRVTSLLKA